MQNKTETAKKKMNTKTKKENKTKTIARKDKKN